MATPLDNLLVKISGVCGGLHSSPEEIAQTYPQLSTSIRFRFHCRAVSRDSKRASKPTWTCLPCSIDTGGAAGGSGES